MSEIPYFFETPIPKYFREAGWFENENTFKFVNWAFSRCQNKSHKVVINGKEIVLEPYEFIAGRLTSSKECFLTEKQFRGQLILMINARILKKGANSRANKFTTYVWLTDRFNKTEGQQKGRQRANRGPTEGHKSIDKKERKKEVIIPNPSSKISQSGDDDFRTDDFSLNSSELKNKLGTTEKKLPTQHNIQSQAQDAKIEVFPGIQLTKKMLDECIEIKGSFENVQQAIESIMRSPQRKYKIYNWPETLAKWEIKPSFKPRIQENEEMARRLELLHENNDNWRCQIYHDKTKDQRGILFYSTASVGMPESYFIAFIDQDFKEKTTKILREKKMQKGLIANSRKNAIEAYATT